jgi:rubrerythrin
MKRLYILCEGQTEEEFIRAILNPYLQGIGVHAQPIICTTKRTPIKKYKGGITSFTKVKKELQRLCGEHPNELVTTMFDLYAFPYDALALQNIPTNVYEKAQYIEQAITDEIGNRFGNMMLNLVLHEFEGLLFSDVSAFENITDQKAVAVLREIRAAVSTPEHINESPETAPSKHIEKAIPDYLKLTDGIDIAEHIGLEKIKSECRHFANWLNKLTTWAKEGLQ